MMVEILFDIDKQHSFWISVVYIFNLKGMVPRIATSTNPILFEVWHLWCARHDSIHMKMWWHWSRDHPGILQLSRCCTRGKRWLSYHSSMENSCAGLTSFISPTSAPFEQECASCAGSLLSESGASGAMVVLSDSSGPDASGDCTPPYDPVYPPSYPWMRYRTRHNSGGTLERGTETDYWIRRCIVPRHGAL